MPTYRGSCHCGAIRYSVETELDGIEICNCSLCSRLGYVHLYVAPEQFRLETSETAFATYQFGTHTSRTPIRSRVVPSMVRTGRTRWPSANVRRGLDGPRRVDGS